MHVFSGNGRKVIVPLADVVAFKSQWPCSGLGDRAYWFEFDGRGDLIDTDVPEHSDGAAAVALSHDCRAFLETGCLPDWLA